MPAGGALTSPPRSKRMDASVFSPSRLLVRRTDAGWKYALSRTIRVVPSWISESPSAHHAGDRRGPFGVGDDEHVRIERALDAVQRRAASRPRRARRITSAPPRSRCDVERVHRLAHLQHHVVGDVDDVVDGAHAGGLEALGEPGGRGPDADVERPARSTAGSSAASASVDVDRDVACRARRATAAADLIGVFQMTDASRAMPT